MHHKQHLFWWARCTQLYSFSFLWPGGAYRAGYCMREGWRRGLSAEAGARPLASPAWRLVPQLLPAGARQLCPSWAHRHVVLLAGLPHFDAHPHVAAMESTGGRVQQAVSGVGSRQATNAAATRLLICTERLCLRPLF